MLTTKDREEDFMSGHRFAVLVDGENISPRYLSAVMAEVNRSGRLLSVVFMAIGQTTI